MNDTGTPRYSLTELADLAGVTPRTVRYYINQGLLPGPVASGPGPKYDDTDLARLRVIKRLQAEHLPLAAIRSQLDGLDDGAIRGLGAGPLASDPPDSALDYIRRYTSSRRATEDAPTEPAVPALASRRLSIGPTDAPPSDVRLERSQWERVDLAPDVELHIRRPLARTTAKRVDRLIAIARDLLGEDPS